MGPLARPGPVTLASGACALKPQLPGVSLGRRDGAQVSLEGAAARPAAVLGANGPPVPTPHTRCPPAPLDPQPPQGWVAARRSWQGARWLLSRHRWAQTMGRGPGTWPRSQDRRDPCEGLCGASSGGRGRRRGRALSWSHVPQHRHPRVWAGVRQPRPRSWPGPIHRCPGRGRARGRAPPRSLPDWRAC